MHETAIFHRLFEKNSTLNTVLLISPVMRESKLMDVMLIGREKEKQVLQNALRSWEVGFYKAGLSVVFEILFRNPLIVGRKRRTLVGFHQIEIGQDNTMGEHVLYIAKKFHRTLFEKANGVVGEQFCAIVFEQHGFPQSLPDIGN